RRGHRSPLPPSGRDRHPVRRHGRLRDARGSRGHRARARHHGAGAHLPRPAGGVPRGAADRGMTLPRALQPPAEYGALPFHRLYRSLAGFRAWRPIVAVIVAAVIYLTVSTILVLVVVAVA